MIEINLEEIKKKLSNYWLYLHFNRDTEFDFIEYNDNRSSKEEREQPTFEVPNEAQILRRYDPNLSFSSRACFGRFTHQSRVASTSRILFIVRMYYKPVDRLDNNYCWFNEEQIDYWLSKCKEESGLDYFYKIKKLDCGYYNIYFDFKQLREVEMKYVLFWTRYLYEFPTNLSVLDTLILKRDVFTEESVINLLTLTTFAQAGNIFHMSYDQCIINLGRFVSLGHLRKGLKFNDTVTSIFTRFAPFSPDYCKVIALPMSSENGSIIKLGNSQTIEPFITKNTLTAPHRFYPVKDWIEKECRFENYTKIYDYLKENELK